MSIKELQVEISDVQAAIYRVALSLDAFLLNGIQYGVLQQDVFPGLLQKTSSNLLRDLASLEGPVPAGSETKIAEVFTSLKEKCRHLIDHVAGLCSYKTMSLQQLHAALARIPTLREECVQLIQELEGCFPTSQPFYENRSNSSSAVVTEFLADLERMFAEK